jgi:UDPglucose--hexose-1-phosphate uridylyltransferase
MGGNLLEDLVQEEVRRAERVVAVDDEAVALCPFAARVPFQVQVVPRRPARAFEDDGPLCARMLHQALGRLRAELGALPPLNMWVRTAPKGAERFCWRIDILPRLAHLAGLEVGTGVHLNALTPERAADQLRG